MAAARAPPASIPHASHDFDILAGSGSTAAPAVPREDTFDPFSMPSSSASQAPPPNTMQTFGGRSGDPTETNNNPFAALAGRSNHAGGPSRNPEKDPFDMKAFATTVPSGAAPTAQKSSSGGLFDDDMDRIVALDNLSSKAAVKGAYLLFSVLPPLFLSLTFLSCGAPCMHVIQQTIIK